MEKIIIEENTESGNSKNMFKKMCLEIKEKFHCSKAKKGTGYALKSGQYAEGNKSY